MEGKFNLTKRERHGIRRQTPGRDYSIRMLVQLGVHSSPNARGRLRLNDPLSMQRGLDLPV